MYYIGTETVLYKGTEIVSYIGTETVLYKGTEVKLYISTETVLFIVLKLHNIYVLKLYYI